MFHEIWLYGLAKASLQPFLQNRAGSPSSFLGIQFPACSATNQDMGQNYQNQKITL